MNYHISRKLSGSTLSCSHCGAEWQAAAQRTSIWPGPVGLALILGTMFLLLFFCLILSDGSGSPSGAARLRAIVEPIENPGAGEGIDPEYYARRFANGEWILGVSRDSHGLFCRLRGGGTVVFKDSRGCIRCFFGHLCGPRAPKWMLGEAQSLDDVYDLLTNQHRFTEYEWP